MTFCEQERSTRTWFECAETSLLTNRTIRNFLKSYKTETWPSVVKWTLLYGILNLNTGNDLPVPLEKIRMLVRNAETITCIERKLLPIHSKMKDLKYDVQEIIDAFEPNPSSKTPKASLKDQQDNKNDSKTHLTEIYPDWWGDGSNNVDSSCPKPSKRKQKPQRCPPRLCYSVPPETREQKEESEEAKAIVPLLRRPQTAQPCQPSVSVSHIADAFLNNRWTAAICQKDKNQQEPLSSTIEDWKIPEAVGLRKELAEATREFPNQRPQSASFWVDFKNTPLPPPSSARRKRGFLMDFGHLDSSRFPPRPVLSAPSLGESSVADLSTLLEDTSQTSGSISEDELSSSESISDLESVDL